MFDRITFVIGEALIALRRHSFMTFSAITTVAISLYLLGGLGYLYISLSKFTTTLGSKFEIYVYLKPGTDTKTISETADAIRKMDGVASVNWLPRDKVWALQKKQEPELTSGIDVNPLPDSYKVILKDLGKGDNVVESVRTLPAVVPDAVEYFQYEQRLVNEALKFIGWLSSAGLLLLLIAGILIFNTVRQAIQARALEIRIMRLVGASRITIGVPFLIEGIIHGAIGGSIGALFVWLTQRAIADRLRSSMQVAIDAFPASQMVAILALTGAAYGVVCSLLALRYRYQR